MSQKVDLSQFVRVSCFHTKNYFSPKDAIAGCTNYLNKEHSDRG